MELEDKLNELDDIFRQPKDVIQDDDYTHNGSFRLDRDSQRTAILHKLTEELGKYSK